MHKSTSDLQAIAGLTDTRRMQNCNNVLVSVIVPVYNSEEYVSETLLSALAQFSGTAELEVIAVNDGSTDDSLALLRRMAETDPRLTVLTQANSGGPSAPRNLALDVAQGKYVFFLDADDVFAQNGLEDIVAAAELHGSDVVLAKFGSINGRHVPKHMFRKTESDADLVKSNAWDSLGPVKLFRRDLIERLKLRFAEDQWIGEDQVFTASMYLNAQRISVLADREYIRIRNRDDGGNITSRRQSLNDKYLTASRLGAVIMQNVPAGKIRDRLMRRIFTSTLPAAVGHLLSSASDLEVTDFMDRFRSEVKEMFTDGVRDYCTHLLKLKYFVLLNGTVSQLRTIGRQTVASLANCYSVAPSGDVIVTLPAELNEIIPLSLLNLGDPQYDVKMVGLAHHKRSVTYTGALSIPGVNIVPHLEQISLVERKTGEVIPLTWSALDATPTKPLGELGFGFSFSRDDLVLRQRLHEGAWGVFLQVTVGRTSQSVRFGKRPDSVPNHRTCIPAEIGLASVTAYFNHGYENLTFDVDSNVHKTDPGIEALFSRTDADSSTKVTTFRATTPHFSFDRLVVPGANVYYTKLSEEAFSLEAKNSSGGELSDPIYIEYDKALYGFAG